MENQQLPTLSELSRHEQDAVYQLQQQGMETRDALKQVLAERNPAPAQPEALDLLHAKSAENQIISKNLDNIDKILSEPEPPLENLSDPNDQVRA